MKDEKKIKTIVLGTLATMSTAAVQPPHICFMLVDDLGFNDFSWRSSDLSEAWPNVNAMIPEFGIKIDTYYTQPICTPTRGAFMSGRYPIRLGLQGPVLKQGSDWALPENETTIADKLSEAGYKTHLVGKWHLGMYSTAVLPTGRGFSTSYGYFGGAEDYLTHSGAYLDLTSIDNTTGKNILTPDHNETNVYSAGLFTSRAVSIVTKHAAEFPNNPLFLYFPMQTVHSPLEVPAIYTSRAPCANITNAQRKIFCGMAAAADESIGNLTKALHTALGDNVLIVIAGDNGGMPGAAGNNFPLRGHKAEVFEGGIRNNAVVYSRSVSLVPEAMRGTTYKGGLVHVTDWHAAFAKLGAGGSTSAGGDSVGFPIDGIAGVFDAIAGNTTSPRKEFLVNILDDATAGGPVGAAYVEWPWKLYLKVDNATWTPVPTTAGDDDETEGPGASMYTTAIDVGGGAVVEMATVNPEDTDFRYFPSIGSSLDMRHPVDRRIAMRMMQRQGQGQARKGDQGSGVAVANPVPDDDESGDALLSLLFNLEDDPTEHVNLYAAQPAVVARLTAKIAALRKEAIPVCQNGGVGAGAGKGCSYIDPQASVVAIASGGVWAPWIK